MSATRPVAGSTARLSMSRAYSSGGTSSTSDIPTMRTSIQATRRRYGQTQAPTRRSSAASTFGAGRAGSCWMKLNQPLPCIMGRQR